MYLPRLSMRSLNSMPINPSRGLLTTPTVLYANPVLMPISMASSCVSNVQNVCFATSSAILSATRQSSAPYCSSSLMILSTTPVPTSCGARTLMSPTTRSAMFSASCTSTTSSGSRCSARALRAQSCACVTCFLIPSKYLCMCGLAQLIVAPLC